MTTNEDLARLAEAATPGDLDTTGNEGDEYGYSETGKWYECPCCDGAGEVHGSTYCNFDDFAMGVQFFGIGNEFKNYEAFFRAANPARILSLLAENAALREALGQIVANCEPEDPPWRDAEQGRICIGEIARSALQADAGDGP